MCWTGTLIKPRTKTKNKHYETCLPSRTFWKIWISSMLGSASACTTHQALTGSLTVWPLYHFPAPTSNDKKIQYLVHFQWPWQSIYIVYMYIYKHTYFFSMKRVANTICLFLYIHPQWYRIFLLFTADIKQYQNSFCAVQCSKQQYAIITSVYMQWPDVNQEGGNFF